MGLAALGVAGASSPHAVEIQIAGALASPSEASLHIRPPAADSGGPEQVVSLALPQASPVEVQLAKGSEIWVELDGYWSERLRVDPARATEPVTLRLLPLGRTLVRLMGPSASSTPPIRVSFSAIDGDLRGELDCTVAEGRVTCPVPEGRWDLRVGAVGYAAVYRQGVAVGRDALDLGEVRLVEGASLVAWVEGPEGLRSVRAVLLRTSVGAASGGTPGVAAATVEVPTSGLLQLSGLEAGEYLLRVEAPGLPPALAGPIRIADQREVRLAVPIRLLPGSDLEVILEPPVSPEWKPWRVRVGRLAADGSIDREGVEEVAVDGRAVFEGLAVGDYQIEVEDERGHIVAWAPTTLGARGTVELVEVPSLEVCGSVTLGGEALRGKLWFQLKPSHETMSRVAGDVEVTTFALPTAEIEVDEEGTFSGWVSGEGRWEVALVDGANRIAAGIHQLEKRRGQRCARLDVELPDTVLDGRVVYEDGTPATATVTLARAFPESGGWATTRTDDQGRFSFRGFTAGEVALEAEDFDARQSDQLVVSVEQDVKLEEQLLTLFEVRQVAGVVVADGAPVPLASVIAWPVSDRGVRQASWTRTVVSDADGRFQLLLRDRPYHFVALAPSLPTRLGRLDGATVEGPVIVDLGGPGAKLLLELEGVEGLVGPSDAGLRWWIASRGISVPVKLLLGASSPLVEGTQLGFLVEAGDYSVCMARGADSRCLAVKLDVASDGVVQIADLYPEAS